MARRTHVLRAVLTAALLLLAALPLRAESYLDLENQVKEFTLDNGMHFIVLEDPSVPVFSFNNDVNVGSANEVTGITGISHILEHMAFKGTREIGTSDFKKEQEAMAREDAVYRAWRDELAKGELADPARVAELEADFHAAEQAAAAYIVSNEFDEIVTMNGGVGMNAGTWTDDTNYFYSFPANRLELWAYLEGSRMSAPVFRAFYTEKDGPVTEERRMRNDNSPVGMIIEQLQNLAFSAHPYHHSTIGYMSDINSITRPDCIDYYRTWYVGRNMNMAVVGDVDFAEFRRYAEKYFTGVSDAIPPVVETVEPAQLGEKRLVIEHSSQPVYVCAYHKGGINDPDHMAHYALADILGQGRTSRLYRSLVQEQKIAAQAFAIPDFPDNKFPNLLLIAAIPVKDKTALDMEEALLAEIEKLRSEGVTAEELAGVKRRFKADFIRGLEGNAGLAAQLSYFQAKTGSWRNLFRQVDKMEAVTAEDIRRVAGEMFQKKNRTVVYIQTVEDEG
jgi:predicted Zn-dependent peptidase